MTWKPIRLLRVCALAILLVVVGVFGLSPTLDAQGNFSAQIQLALRNFLASANTWTGTQTFDDITVTGTCTGCNADLSGASDTQVLFNNAGVIGGFGTWDGSILTVPGSILANATVDGSAAGFLLTNLSNTADSTVVLNAATTGDSATGTASLGLTVHEGGANDATFTIAVDGASGDAFPATTITAPGALTFSVNGTSPYVDFGSTAAIFTSPSDGDFYSLYFRNTSDTADSAAAISAVTTGDNATGLAGLQLIVHSTGANEAAFTVAVDGASGNATPATTLTTPGALLFTALTSTGAATGKKVVCVDTATGQLYASSTGTDCSN